MMAILYTLAHNHISV